MDKIYLKNGKEVHVGDTISCSFEATNPILGMYKSTVEVTLTEYTLPKLLKAGILSMSKCQEDSTIPMTIGYYVEKIALKLGWNVSKTYNYLNTIATIHPAALFSILLREVAIELDKKYEDHIENSPEIYVVSMMDGRITKANKAHIKNYRNFAAFRTIEDAKIACRLLRDSLRKLYAKR